MKTIKTLKLTRGTIRVICESNGTFAWAWAASKPGTLSKGGGRGYRTPTAAEQAALEWAKKNIPK